jgi:pSer/pThr/pTyr-binding forkhead associated (FHA) protein
VVRRPDYSKVQVPLDREITVIGRAVSCDIVIKDAKSSRKHARVCELSPGSYELEDMNSRNGTWSDGVQVSKMRLMNGDSFSVGNAVFTLRVHHHHDID